MTSDNPDDNSEGKAYWAENQIISMFVTERSWQIKEFLNALSFALPELKWFELAPESVTIDGSVKVLAEEVQIGTVFGKQGTLVNNPEIKVNWGQYSRHGFQRMLNRNITTDQVNSWVATGKTLQQGENKFLFLTTEGAAVVDNGKLVTVMSKYDFDEVMTGIVKILSGQ